MILPIKKDAQMGAKNHVYDNTKYLTNQLAGYNDLNIKPINLNDPYWKQREKRRRSRYRKMERRQIVARVIKYTVSIAVLVAAWIVVTGMYQ